MRKLNIAIACGGSGGHVYPGMAVGEELQRRGHRVALWLVGRDVELEAAKDWAGPIVTVQAKGLPSGFSFRTIKRVGDLLRARREARRILKRELVDVMLAMGSYGCVGPVLAARSLGIPYVVHEANVVPGRANRFLYRGADAVAASFEETRFYLPGRKIEVTGMPLRSALLHPKPTMKPAGLDDDRLTLLVVGGSQGARRLNDIVSQALCALGETREACQVIHLTGPVDEEQVKMRYAEHGVPCVVKAFAHDMATLYQAADLAICRSGAATCAELSAFGLPALLCPFPFAANDHQTRNAESLEKNGAAVVVAEKELTVNWLVDYLDACIQDLNRLAVMSAASRKRTPASAAGAVADLMEGVAAD